MVQEATRGRAAHGCIRQGSNKWSCSPSVLAFFIPNHIPMPTKPADHTAEDLSGSLSLWGSSQAATLRLKLVSSSFPMLPNRGQQFRRVLLPTRELIAVGSLAAGFCRASSATGLFFVFSLGADPAAQRGGAGRPKIGQEAHLALSLSLSLSIYINIHKSNVAPLCIHIYI